MRSVKLIDIKYIKTIETGLESIEFLKQTDKTLIKPIHEMDPPGEDTKVEKKEYEIFTYAVSEGRDYLNRPIIKECYYGICVDDTIDEVPFLDTIINSKLEKIKNEKTELQKVNNLMVKRIAGLKDEKKELQDYIDRTWKQKIIKFFKKD
jgi:hypothetical protein